MTMAIIVLLSGLIGGFIGGVIYYYILSNIVMGSDKEDAIQRLPFSAVKVILVMAIIFNLGIFQLLIIAIISSFSYHCIKLSSREELDLHLEELDILWKKISGKDDQ